MGSSVADMSRNPYARTHRIRRSVYIPQRQSRLSKGIRYYLSEYVGRPESLYYAERLTETLGGAKIYLKREDLNHTGAHKINSAIGQILLARWMGKKRIIAETGAGQHGVATATVAAKFDMECEVYMGEGGYRTTSTQRIPHAIDGNKGCPS